MAEVCPSCHSAEMQWSTESVADLRVDALRCRRCDHVAQSDDWIAPLPPSLPGSCMNCGGIRRFERCIECELSRTEDDAVHEELRVLVDAKATLLGAAQAAASRHRRLLALKLATAAAHLEQDVSRRDVARGLRVWLLSAVGEPQAALDDARSWVERTHEPSALALASLGQQLQHADDRGGAVDAYGRSLALDPSQHAVRARRARLLLAVSRHGQAGEQAARVLEAQADEDTIGIALDVAGLVCEHLEELGRDDEIELLLERGAAQVHRSARLLAQRARLAALNGDKQRARRDLELARRLEEGLDVYTRVESALKQGGKDSWWSW